MKPVLLALPGLLVQLELPAPLVQQVLLVRLVLLELPALPVLPALLAKPGLPV
ncbi:hypothetical protein D3C76_1810530 [compost metagenome]